MPPPMSAGATHSSVLAWRWKRCVMVACGACMRISFWMLGSVFRTVAARAREIFLVAASRAIRETPDALCRVSVVRMRWQEVGSKSPTKSLQS